jgi:uncharacterized protein involved in outer membrane biogenesis
MEVSVAGRLGIGFSPGLYLSLEDVHIRNRGVDVVSAPRARLGIALLPLLRGEVRIGKLALTRPRISVERDRDGRFNFEKPEAAQGRFPALDLARVSVSSGTLVYADQLSAAGFEAGDCNLDIRRLRLSGGEGPDLLKGLSFTAELACGEVRRNDFTVTDVKLSAGGNDGVFELKRVTMRVFGGQGSGSIGADFAGAVPVYRVRYSLSQFRVEEFLKILSPNQVAVGSMDFSADLSMQGKTVSAMTRTAAGEASLRGANLRLDGIDIDEKLSRFESSQNFNLVDVGAFFFAGPFGLVVTKGYNFASIFQGSGGRSEIRALVSTWKVERGVARALDVAMATNENRVALQGALDFAGERFDHVTVALVDAEGCAVVRQKIRGTFQKPVVEQPNILKSLTGPMRELLKQGRGLFPGGECEAFYAGSVAPPQ